MHVLTTLGDQMIRSVISCGCVCIESHLLRGVAECCLRMHTLTRARGSSGCHPRPDQASVLTCPLCWVTGAVLGCSHPLPLPVSVLLLRLQVSVLTWLRAPERQQCARLGLVLLWGRDTAALVLVLESRGAEHGQMPIILTLGRLRQVYAEDGQKALRGGMGCTRFLNEELAVRKEHCRASRSGGDGRYGPCSCS